MRRSPGTPLTKWQSRRPATVAHEWLRCQARVGAAAHADLLLILRAANGAVAKGCHFMRGRNIPSVGAASTLCCGR